MRGGRRPGLRLQSLREDGPPLHLGAGRWCPFGKACFLQVPFNSPIDHEPCLGPRAGATGLCSLQSLSLIPWKTRILFRAVMFSLGEGWRELLTGRPNLGPTLGGQLPWFCGEPLLAPGALHLPVRGGRGLCFGGGVERGGPVASLRRAPSPPPCPRQTKEVL